jgi:tRNA(fMet)-specific endonuclease VapC
VKFLLDTDTFSVAARDGSAELLSRLEGESLDDIALSVVTVGEIEFGLSKRMPPPRIAARIVAMRQSFRILTLDERAASAYGRLRQQLQSQGIPIGPNDLWIAAHALSEDLTVVTGNTREFARVPGLRVENWLR